MNREISIDSLIGLILVLVGVIIIPGETGLAMV